MNLIVAFAAGTLIGLLFYGGLWLTIRMLLTARHPVLLTVSSFWLRLLVALAGFLFAMNGKWQNVLACLAGFAIGRGLVSALLPKGAGVSRCT